MKKPVPVDLDILESNFAQLERNGVVYSYGGKARMGASIPSIHGIDCSGYSSWGLNEATHGQWTLSGSSQDQREQCEALAAAGIIRKVNYRDAAAYINQKRLFVCFIMPFENGCGKVGHVWFLSQFDDGNNGTKAGTLESHGGGGCVSRPWNYPTLLREVYSCYELPTVQGAK